MPSPAFRKLEHTLEKVPTRLNMPNKTSVFKTSRVDKNLIERVYERTGYDKKVLREILEVTFFSIGDLLCENARVDLGPLGVLFFTPVKLHLLRPFAKVVGKVTGKTFAHHDKPTMEWGLKTSFRRGWYLESKVRKMRPLLMQSLSAEIAQWEEKKQKRKQQREEAKERKERSKTGE